MRETKLGQIISDKVLELTKASNGCPEHGKNVMTLPRQLSQHATVFVSGFSRQK